MTLTAFLGAIESGLIFGLVALGGYLTFRVLDFPDLTVDGSFPLGAAVAAALIVAGFDPYAATGAAILAGAAAGLVTAWLSERLKILHLLASILTMVALYSVNLRIMGRPNLSLLMEPTVFTYFDSLDLVPRLWLVPMVMTGVTLVCLVLVNLFLNTRMGLALRATGANARMAAAQGVRTGLMVGVGVGLANALVALAGALFAQSQGAADVTMGVGVVIIGLASIILGEAVMSTRTILLATLACVIGAVLYRLAIGLALNAEFIGLQAQDLNLVTAILVAVAFVVPGVRDPLRRTVRTLLGNQARDRGKP